MAGFEEDPAPAPADTDGWVLRLDAYEGPIDLLLDQARANRIDLTAISILDLAEQYLAFIERARQLRLEIAADYLVMAAWLAYLKSRLLLPAQDDPEEEPTGAELAAALAFQLRRLDAMRQAATQLFGRPRRGVGRFPRGEAAAPLVNRRIRIVAGLHELLRAYGDHLRRTTVPERLTIQASRLMAPEQALVRMRALLGDLGDWASLHSFLPKRLDDPLGQRSALAATLVASLELAKEGAVDVRQDRAFGPIMIKRKDPRP